MDALRGRRLRHQEAWELLPWYVNGTLAAEERQAVDEHLERCPLCQSEVAASRRLSDAVRLAVEMPPSDERVARLLARLEPATADGSEAAAEALPAPVPAPATPPPPRRAARLPASVRWVITLQAAAVLALAVGLGTLIALQRPPAAVAPPPPPAAGYRTLAGGAPAAATPDDGALAVRVVFSPAASETELRGLLLDSAATIAGGPSPAGVYTLHLGGEDPAAGLARLRGDRLVELAEPVVVRPEGEDR